MNWLHMYLCVSPKIGGQGTLNKWRLVHSARQAFILFVTCLIQKQMTVFSPFDQDAHCWHITIHNFSFTTQFTFFNPYFLDQILHRLYFTRIFYLKLHNSRCTLKRPLKIRIICNDSLFIVAITKYYRVLNIIAFDW